MLRLYNIIISLYWLYAHIGFAFSKKAGQWVKGRQNWRNKLNGKINKNDKWIWFHCSSLGEFEDGRTFIESTRRRYAEVKILLTFYSPSGYENMKQYGSADLIMYMPFDFKKNVKDFLNIVNPTAVFFIRSEIWMNYVLEIKRREIPFYLISLNLNHKSKFIAWPFGRLYSRGFGTFDIIFCQNEMTASIVHSLSGNQNLEVAGNTRIDRIKEVTDKIYENKKIENFIGKNYCIVAGSVSLHEEKMIYESMKKIKNIPVRWIIAPHTINKERIEKSVRKNSGMVASLSDYTNTGNHKILYIDCIGILPYVYRYGNMAIVGGGFSKKGIHNIIEPAMYGLPIVFGPNHRNYDEALEMLANNFANIYKNSRDLAMSIENFFQHRNDKAFQNEIKKQISSKTGATGRIESILNARLDEVLF